MQEKKKGKKDLQENPIKKGRKKQKKRKKSSLRKKKKQKRKQRKISCFTRRSNEASKKTGSQRDGMFREKSAF